MSSVPILTVVAEPPPGIEPASNVSRSEAEVFILDTVARLEKFGHGPVPRAFTISAMNACIKSFARSLAPGTKFVFQLVGHAEPGRLELGKTWNGRVFDGTEFYALDANPSLLNTLYKWRNRFERVVLAGCGVGADSSTTEATDGTSLMFALERVLRCPVTAAYDSVVPEQFGEDGLFSGPTRSWNTQGVYAWYSQPTTIRRSSTITYERVMFRPPWNGGPVRTESLCRETCQLLRDTYAIERDGSELGLVAPELELSTLMMGPDHAQRRGRAFLAFGGRCLIIDDFHPEKRAGRSRSLYLFATDDNAAKAAHGRLHEILDPE
jgi:hypothetical protein